MGPFGSAAFRWLWCSSLASSTAAGIERTTTAWLALERGGAVGVGLVLAARMLPSLLFGLTAGTLADRGNRRRQLLVVSAAGVPLLVVLSWLGGAGALGVPELALLSLGVGCLTVFDAPARQALVMDAVGRDRAPNGLGLNALAARLCTALGAFSAGLVIPLLGSAPAYLVAALAYGVAVPLVALMRLPPVSRPAGGLPPFGQALRVGARLILDLPAVRTLSIVGIVGEVFAFSQSSAVPAVARDVLQAGAEGLGTLNAATAVGGTVAVVLLALLPGRVPREPLLGVVFLIFGGSLVALAQAGSLGVAAAVLLVTGACAAAFDLLQQTLLQMAVPEEQRGRAIGVWLFGLGSAPIGLFGMGALVAALGAPAALALNGTIVLGAAATLMAAAPAYRALARE